MNECEGITRKNKKCKNKAIEGQIYCPFHIHGLFNKITFCISEILGVKRRFLLVFIIFMSAIFLIQTYIEYDIEKILNEVEKKPDVFAFVSPLLQNEPWGDFLPVVILNTGDLPLYNVTVAIKSCVMMNMNKSFEIHHIPILLPYNEYIIKFGDKDTIVDFKSVWCTPSSDYPYPSIAFYPFSNQNNTAMSTTCGYCKYIIEIYSDKINRTIKDYYRGPINATISYSSD